MSSLRLRRAMRELLRVLADLERCPRCTLDADGCHARPWRKAYEEAREAVRVEGEEDEKKPN